MTTTMRSDYIELVKNQPLVTIHKEAQYENALKVFKELSIKDAQMSKGEREYFEVLSLLIKHYEDEHFNFTHLTPQEVLRSFMEDHALTQAAVAQIAGDYESNISAFLTGKRNLTRKAILRLAAHFAVDPALFLPPLLDKLALDQGNTLALRRKRLHYA